MLFFNKISSFFFMLILAFTSLFGLSLNGYESKQLFNDVGFEIHGNFDCTIGIKNFKLITYNKI